MTNDYSSINLSRKQFEGVQNLKRIKTPEFTGRDTRMIFNDIAQAHRVSKPTPMTKPKLHPCTLNHSQSINSLPEENSVSPTTWKTSWNVFAHRNKCGAL